MNCQEVETLNQQPMYPVLAGKMAERGIKKSTVAGALKCSMRAFYNKMNGVTDFTWSEACILQRRFFPDCSKEELLQRRTPIDHANQ